MMRVVIPWYTIEKMPEIMACEAITVAAILRMRNGIYSDLRLGKDHLEKDIFCTRGGSWQKHPGRDN